MIRHVKILQGHEGAIYKLHFDQNNGKLYSVGGDGWLVEWDVQHSDDGTLIARVPDQVFALAVTTDHYFLGSFQGNFYVLDRESQTILHQERAHRHGIFSILATGKTLLTLGGDGKMIEWDHRSFDKIRELHLSAKSLRTQSLNPSEDLLAVGASDGSIFILSFPDLYLKKQIESAHDPSVFALAWVDDLLVSGGRDALLKTWDVTRNFELKETLNAHWYAIYDLAVTPDYLITGSRDKTIRWWDRRTYQPIKTIQWGDVMEAHVHSVNSLAVNPATNIMYSGSEDRTIRAWQF